MDPGRLDKRAAFHRRAFIEGRPHDRGDFETTPYLTVWASYIRSTGSEKLEGGRLTDVEVATLVVRDSTGARAITSADRVTVLGRDFAIQSVGLPSRRTGLISIDVSSDLGD